MMGMSSDRAGRTDHPSGILHRECYYHLDWTLKDRLYAVQAMKKEGRCPNA